MCFADSADDSKHGVISQAPLLGFPPLRQPCPSPLPQGNYSLSWAQTALGRSQWKSMESSYGGVRVPTSVADAWGFRFAHLLVICSACACKGES